MIKDALVERIRSRTATIGVIGLGYIGLPLVLRFVGVGFKVIGFDISNEKVDLLNGGRSCIEYLDGSRIRQVLDVGFVATTDYSRISDVDAIIICVPTPLNRNRKSGLGFVVNTVDSLAPFLRPRPVALA